MAGSEDHRDLIGWSATLGSHCTSLFGDVLPTAQSRKRAKATAQTQDLPPHVPVVIQGFEDESGNSVPDTTVNMLPALDARAAVSVKFNAANIAIIRAALLSAENSYEPPPATPDSSKTGDGTVRWRADRRSWLSIRDSWAPAKGKSKPFKVSDPDDPIEFDQVRAAAMRWADAGDGADAGDDGADAGDDGDSVANGRDSAAAHAP